MTTSTARIKIFCRTDLPEMLEGLAQHLRTGTPVPLGLAFRGLLRRVRGKRLRTPQAPLADLALSNPSGDLPDAVSNPAVSGRAVRAAEETIRLFIDTEPDLARLSKQPLDRLPVQPHLDTPRHRAWLRLVGSITHRYRRIIIIPWLVRGGAERVALHALRAAHDFDGPQSTLLLIADYAREDAADWLPPETEIRSLSDLGETLAPQDRLALVVSLIHSMQPESVLNVNSEATWNAFALHGRALSGIARLYAGLFCPDYDQDMHRADYGFRYFRQCLPYLSGIYLDNAAFAAELSVGYGLPENERKKLKVVYQPAPEGIPAMAQAATPRVASPDTPRALWASRLATQKKPTILPDIARHADWCSFEAFGHGPTDMVEGLRRQAPKNLRFCGPYASFDALQPGRFDVFLYTTLWDGIPNVLLEAAAAGLPIVAPMIGGIPELINEDTGWPVSDPNNASAYAASLARAFKDPAETMRRSNNLRQLIAKRHSWQCFVAQFATPPSFLSAAHEIRKMDLLDA